MRIKKHKAARRSVKFYQVTYGFRQPYKVLLDGNFIHICMKTDIGDVKRKVESLLGGPCKLYTTLCVIKELRKLGGKMIPALQFAMRTCNKHQCGHKDSKLKPLECVKEVLGKRNAEHWWIATQDANLQQYCRNLTACPVILISPNGMQLERPPEQDKARAEMHSAAQQALPKQELQSDALEGLEQLQRERKPRTQVKFRHNKAKGPNPLAVRKKVVKPRDGGKGGPKEMQKDGSASRVRQRQRGATQQEGPSG